MTRKETRFTNFLRSRGFGAILVGLSAWLIWNTPAMPVDSPVLSMIPAPLSCALSLVVIVGIAAIMVAINRQFTLLKTLSIFFAAYFVYITAATPGIASRLSVSAILAAVVLSCMWILYSLYNRRYSDRRIFLIFCLLSGGTLLDWKFSFFIPLFIVGLAQMRILRFKKIIAAIIGLVTPPWIAFGSGLMEIPQIPDIYYTPPSLLFEEETDMPFLCIVAFTMLTGVVFGAVGLFRMLGFNSRARAFNGFLAMLGIYTGVLAIINFTRLEDYLMLLNACVAFQTGHFFRVMTTRRGYIAILLLLAAYAGLYLWSVRISNL